MANAIQTMIITEDSPDRSPASDHYESSLSTEKDLLRLEPKLKIGFTGHEYGQKTSKDFGRRICGFPRQR